MLKYLRIAVTALSLTACVLLVALWVRSHWWENSIGLLRPNANDLWCTTRVGTLYVDSSDDPFGEPVTTNEWWFASSKIKKNLDPTIQDRPRGFSYRNDGYISAGVPFWSFALLTAGVAVAPWLQWRFSLRTLLIATTLVAVGLGLIVVAM